MSDETYCLATWPKYGVVGKPVTFDWVVSCAAETAKQRLDWGEPKDNYRQHFDTSEEQLAGYERSLLGEAAYAARCHQPWVINEHGDGGYDMLTPPGSVDVKTTYPGNPLRINLVGAKQAAKRLRPHYYLLVWCRDSHTPAEVQRYAHKQLLLEAPVDHEIKDPAHTLRRDQLIELTDAGFPELQAGEVRWD